MASQLLPVLTSHTSPSPLGMKEFPAKLADRKAPRDTVLEDYGAQTLVAFSHFFPWNLLDILSH